MTQLNELLLRAVLETVGEAIVTVDAAGSIVMVNDEAQRIWGYSEEELIGRPLTMLMPANYRASHTTGMQRYLETGVARVLGRKLELEGLHRDGRIFPLEIRIQETRAGDKLYFTAAVRDLTDGKSAERRLAAAYEITRTLAEAVTLEEATPKILAAICECLGWQMGILWRVNEDQHTLRIVEVWRQPGGESTSFEDSSRQLTFVRGTGLPGRIWASGEAYWIADVQKDPVFLRGEAAKREGFRGAFGFPILLGGQVLGVMEFLSREIRQPDSELLAMMESIGSQIGQFMERIRAREEREKLIGQLQEALQMRDRFLSIASHELKTPVTSLLGYAQLLQRRAEREGFVDPRNQRALSALIGQAHRLHRLLISLLDLSRLQMEQFSIDRGVVDLAALTRRAVEEMQPLLEYHTLQLAGTDQPLVVEGDELRLEQVLHNLLQNAIKYSPQGGPIEVVIERRDIHACVRIRDKGIGIPADALPNLFSRFFRAANVNRQQINGMGIGLYLVREIVNLHQGTIEVESHEGEGSTFSVLLPLCVSESTLESVAS
ncbi:MAG: hypothetical protein KatS3mg057_2784 [Herpetosiphonaceae bacterium]|nr:MAG: hypothetical protein KatS3mg057_2784 [Herpetosiphonaceae bacterium]